MHKKLSNALLAVALVGCSSSGPTGADMSLVPAAQPSGAPSLPSAAPAGTGTTGSSAASPTSAPTQVPGATGVPAMGAAPATAPATPGPAADGTASPATDAPDAVAGGPISKDCQGFSFEGLVYSPGGDVLPNKCAPFHATTNNPFAVRCIDAWPWFKTDFPGDEYCILPPTPGKGIQIGHHPQGEYDAWFEAVSQGDMSAYDKANLDESWIFEPGDEEERNIVIRHMNEGGKFWRVASRMRGGSHHMIAATSSSTNTFVWAPGSVEGVLGGTPVPGSQRPDDNSPQSFEIPAEDVGLYREIPANVGVLFNMHHFNPTDRAMLKEAWENLWWTENATRPVSGVGGLSVQQALETFAQPGQTVDFHYAIPAPGKVRVLSLFGHRHAWTTNFTAWVERQGKEPEIIYQSFDWFDEPTYQYNSVVQNPVPSPANRTDGAYSGIVNLEQGDELHFNCHIEYTDERAVEVNSPVTPSENGPLRFANEAFTAEMCILFGGVEGTNGSVARQAAPPPDFAKSR
jgi:hypothetical protein